MKQVLFVVLSILFLLPFGAEAKAQSLSFSQAKLVTQTETVQAGKVWKVVSVLSNASLNVSSFGSYFTNTLAISVNGQLTNIKSRVVMIENDMAAADGMDVTDLPLWLPAGTSLGLNQNATGISVIEFTVNP